MQELVPVLLGLVAGGICARIRSVRMRGEVLGLLSMAGGTLAVTVNGEWGAGGLALPIDTALVAASAVTVLVGRVLVRRLRVRGAAECGGHRAGSATGLV